MNDRTRRYDKYYADKEPRDIDDPYVLDAASGLYKPKSYDSEDKGKTQTHHVVYEGPIDVKTRRDWISIVLTALTLVALVKYTDITNNIYGTSQVTAVASIEASRATRNSVDLAQQALQLSKDQFRVEERPWIVPTTAAANPQKEFVMVAFGADNKPTGDMVFNVVVNVENVGKTPAVHLLNTFAEFKEGPRDETTEKAKNFVPHYASGEGSFVAPSQPPITIASDHFSQMIHTADFEKVKTGEWVVFLVGGVKYTDIFEPKIKPYETRYCFRYHPNGLPWGVCPFGYSIK